MGESEEIESGTLVDKMMNFDVKQSQNGIWDLLKKSIENNKIGSAYLFSGPSGVGKEAMAIEYGATINKQHFFENKSIADASYTRFKTLQHELLKLIVPLPAGKTQKGNVNVLESLNSVDLELLNENIVQKCTNPFHKIILPNATRIRINSIRELRKSLYLKSDDIGRKMVLIFDAHLLTAGQAESANALLKILEEPPPNTTLILVTDKKDQLLPTILSRCQHIDFPPLTKETIKNVLLKSDIDSKSAELISGISLGNMRMALTISNDSVENLLKSIQDLSKSVINEDGEKWRKFINDNSQMIRKEISQFQHNIFLLQLWFKSVYRLRIGVSDELHQPDLIDFMQQFNQKYPNADLHKIDIFLEDALEAVGRNLYMSLILTNLLINIQKHLK
jgi:DNA polymerase-3 subunit delta'